MEARVTLRPGAKGTKKLTEQFGDRLVCVRYRYDIEHRRRYKTVEIIVDEADWVPAVRSRPSRDAEGEPQRIVGLQVPYDDIALRQSVRSAGGVWDAGMKLWLIPERIARLLGAEKRIVRVLPVAAFDEAREKQIEWRDRATKAQRQDTKIANGGTAENRLREPR